MHPHDFLAAADRRGRVRIKWHGTASYEISCDDHVVLIDPYLSRVDLVRYLTLPLKPNTSRIDAAIGRADAIVVGHSHFDHALDVPHIAARTGAIVYGSRSTANLCRAAGLPQRQIVTCRPGDVFETGPFKVTMTPSQHSRFALGRVPYAGDIPATCRLPMRGSAYRVGDVFGIAIELDDLCIYHGGSANLIDEAIRHHHVDLFLMCSSGRFATDRYLPRILNLLRPRIVMPMHYDVFFLPADRKMQVLPRVRFGELVDEIHAFDPGMQVETLAIGGSTEIG